MESVDYMYLAGTCHIAVCLTILVADSCLCAGLGVAVSRYIGGLIKLECV